MRYLGALAEYTARAGQYNPAQNDVGVTVVPHPELSLAWATVYSVQAHGSQVSDPELAASQWGARAALSHGRFKYWGGTRAVAGWGASHSASGDRLVLSPSLYSTAWACACCAVGPAYSARSSHLRASQLGSAIGANLGVSSASPVLGFAAAADISVGLEGQRKEPKKRDSPASKP